ncbi:MAG: hypothetical protein Q9M26_09440 [Mariprofundales bacterium]|nr:hypothetical protein [Mariprofundales bacterium]
MKTDELFIYGAYARSRVETHTESRLTVKVPWLHTQEVLARFAANTPHAKALFVEFVAQSVGKKGRKDLHHNSHLGKPRGDDHFADQVLKKTDSEMLLHSGLIEGGSCHEI